MYKPPKKIIRRGKEWKLFGENVASSGRFDDEQYLKERGYKTITLRSPPPDYNYLVYKHKIKKK